MTDTWNPQQYERFKNERSQPFLDLMDLLDGNTKIHRAIDLGCGTGELTKLLHDRFQVTETLGIDSSEKMIEKARAQGSVGLSFQKSDIQKFSGDHLFDLVFSNAALQWCTDHEALFARIFQSIQPGGQLLVQMPMNFDYPTHTLADQVASQEPYRSLLNDSKGEAGRAVFKIEKYAEILYRLGFREQKVAMRVYAHILSDREQVIEWVKGTMLTSFEKRLPPEIFQKFVGEYRQKLFQVLPDEKPFFYPFKRMLMWARR